jgi:hypothetical protein
VDSLIPLPCEPRAATLNPQPPHPVWKAKAVEGPYRSVTSERPSRVTRESIWTRAYILWLSPADAAKVAGVSQHAAPIQSK